MDISYIDLFCSFLIYSFLGWIFETIFMMIRDKKLCNRGFFSLPFCPAYGFIMVVLIVQYSHMQQTDYIIKFIAATVISAVGMYLAGELTKWASGHTMWNYQEQNLFSGRFSSLLLGLGEGLLFMTAETLIQPLLTLLFEYIPHIVKLIFCDVFGALLIFDLILIILTMRKKRTPQEVEKLLSEGSKEKESLEERISSRIWKRLKKTYPELNTNPDAKLPNFAQGICFNKLVWVFLICSFLGDLIETVFVRFSGGVWMSRSSLIYGPFSVVWGLGAVLLTIILHPLSKKEDRYIFLAGCFIGGVYEYSCSVFTQYVLHTTFWDYSNMPFNIGGRTNLLYCFFWGLLGLVWLKILYPPLSNAIEKIPTVVGTIITWFVILAFTCDIVISAGALIRYTDRQNGDTAHNTIDEFFDTNYPDSLVEKRWQNMKLGGVSGSDEGSSAGTDNSSGQGQTPAASPSDAGTV